MIELNKLKKQLSELKEDLRNYDIRLEPPYLHIALINLVIFQIELIELKKIIKK